MTTARAGAHVLAASDHLSVPVSPLVRWTLYLTTFSIPLQYPDRFAFEVSTITGAAFLLTSLLQPSICYGRVPWALGAYTLYVYIQLVALVVQGTSYPGGLFLDEVTRATLLLLLWIVFFWACTNLFRDERIYRSALWAFVAGCLVRAALPLAGIGRTAHVQGTGGERVTAFGQNANQSGQTLALGLLALIGLAYIQSRGRSPARWLGWGSVGLIAVGQVQTGSRGSLLALCAGLLVYLSAGRSLRSRIRNAAVVAIGVGLFYVLVSRSEVMQGRIARAEAGSFSQREKIFPIVFAMVRERPVLGWGPITNKYEIASRLGDPTHMRRDPHNIVLEMLSSCGLLGAAAFFAGLWLCLRQAWRARAGPRGLVPLAMLLAILVSNMSENRLSGPLLWLILACALSSSGDAQSGPDSGAGRRTSPLVPGSAAM
jgi:O-antigen ligase